VVHDCQPRLLTIERVRHMLAPRSSSQSTKSSFWGRCITISSQTPTFQWSNDMQILYINNDGGGFADYVEAEEGTTVVEFFQDHVSGGAPKDYLIRVNRQPVAAEQVMQNGDRVSFTPVKIEGACAS
jgi:hypothetical protein